MLQVSAPSLSQDDERARYSDGHIHGIGRKPSHRALEPAWAASHDTAARKGPGHKKSPVAEDGARAVSICSNRRTRRAMENTPSLKPIHAQASRINPVSSENRSLGRSEVSSFARLSRLRESHPLRNQPSIGSQTFMREP